MKKLVILFLSLFFVFGKVMADEGMWLLPFLSKMNIKDMKSRGMKLSAQDIYSINKSSIKDAIIIFGEGCTGEVVSNQGLILTNHHCGFSSIQQHSTLENDYLKNGFWAMSKEQEIPTPGLQVTFIREIIDVSSEILPLLSSDTISESAREALIGKLKNKIIEKKKEQLNASNLTVSVKDFFGGNQYLMFVTEIFNDIRMVGAPPTSIGKFGGDTDNWMWPRHTGDFSMFRIYADSTGKPGPYSKENIAYVPIKHLNVSLKGVKHGDFAMIMGFPGTTNRYMSSYEIDQVMSLDNPNRIYIRGIRQAIMQKDMLSSDKIRIQYASKYAMSSNYWKNSIGMNRGLKRLKVKDEKLALESEFSAWVAASPERAKYAEALPLKKEAVEGRMPYYHVIQYTSETLTRGIELFGMAAYGALIENAIKQDTLSDSYKERVKRTLAKLYKDYNKETDCKIAKAMIKIFAENVESQMQPSIYEQVIKSQFAGDYDKYIDYLFDNSLFADKVKFDAFIANPSLDVLVKDPAYVAYKSIFANLDKVRPAYLKYQDMFKKGHRLFIEGLLEMQQDKKNYPDANSTIRLTYGQVLPYEPADAVSYDYYTTLSGVMEKEDTSNPTEFTVPVKLKELYKSRDFGRYAYKGDVPVGFISNNDITGGNSGSPVLNAKGELIGLAFDGNWEAMSGDIAFEAELQRTINVDIRYVLFIIDKYAGAKHLVDEMTIIE